MPTESEALAWLATHWPSLIVAGIFARAYLKLRSFLSRLETMEGRMKRLMRICAKQHPGKGAEIYDDTPSGDDDD